MDPEESVTRWFRKLESDEPLAAQQLWERFYSQLVGLARRRLAAVDQTLADAEDVVQSAFFSFVQGVRQNRFPSIHDREDLWKLLVVITARKASAYARSEGRQKRGGGRKRIVDAQGDGHAYFDQLADGNPPPDLAVGMIEELRLLLGRLDEQQRQVALLKMNGYLNKEIAETLGCSPRTVSFRLDEIRRMWSEDA